MSKPNPSTTKRVVTAASAFAVAVIGTIAVYGISQSIPAQVPLGKDHPALPKASAANPVVLELFQSQGCSSCPPANENINALADREDILALSFSVTYWDYLGWKDRFAQPAFTERQYEYSRGGGRRGVYTPQVIINGGRDIVGASKSELASAIQSAGPATGGPEISVDGARVALAGAKPAATNVVWLVRYDPGSRNVPIRAGENNGRTLPHRNVVVQLVKLGDWNGGRSSYAIPNATENGLVTAVLVQASTGGAVVSARKI
jgi:hypothetical protein